MPGGHVELSALQQLRVAIDVDIRDVGNVIALLLQPACHRMLDQRAGVGLGRVRSIEADLIAAVAVEWPRGGQVIHVQVDAAPKVVGLPTRHVGLHQQRRGPPSFSNHERDVALEAVVRSELEQVVAAQPARIHGELDCSCPRTFEQAGTGADARLRLGHDSDGRAGANQARAEPLVMTDAIQIPTHALGTAHVDENVDRISRAGRSRASVAFDFAAIGGTQQSEIARALNAILDSNRRLTRFGGSDRVSADRRRFQGPSNTSGLPKRSARGQRLQ